MAASQHLLAHLEQPRTVLGVGGPIAGLAERMENTMSRTTPTPGGDLRVPRRAELPRAAWMMAGEYLKEPLGRLPLPVRAAIAVPYAAVLYAGLVAYRPYLRYWTRAARHHDQIIVSLVQRAERGHLVARLVVVAIVVFGPALAADARVGVGPLLLLVGVMAIVCAAQLTPYKGRIWRAGPRVKKPDITLGMAASTAPAGMASVRAHLVEHHNGKLATLRARNTHTQQLYKKLGFEVVKPGFGNMKGIVGAEDQANPKQPDDEQGTTDSK